MKCKYLPFKEKNCKNYSSLSNNLKNIFIIKILLNYKIIQLYKFFQTASKFFISELLK